MLQLRKCVLARQDRVTDQRDCSYIDEVGEAVSDYILMLRNKDFRRTDQVFTTFLLYAAVPHH